MKTTKNAIIHELKTRKDRSAWDVAVTQDAIELIDELSGLYVDADSLRDFEHTLLNGADNWSHYSWSGCALVYDGDIAAHYCTPSELERTRHGERRPNRHEEWLDVQARALSQAAKRAYKALIAATR